jgi:hypothetical protein
MIITDEMVRAGQAAFLKILETVSWPARVERMKGSLEHVSADQLIAAYKAMRKLDPEFRQLSR